MLESLNTGIFEYEKLKPEEMQRRGILGRLVGVMADTVNPTRNGRSYSAKLWENVFNNPIMKERIENNCCFGELGHPADREETDMEKIAICMDGLPKKDKDGKLQAVFNILDTPNGRILKTLCDYGCNIGISSRGSGDLIEDFYGNESVDPDTYNCEGWDAVLIPAVKEARLKYVTESLEKKRYNKTLRTRLQEAILKESEDNQKNMKDSLDNLGIDLDAKMDADFGDDMSIGDIADSDIPMDDLDNTSELEDNTTIHKGIKILHSPRTDKYYCEIDGESYTFNNEKNAKIWIDMNVKDNSLTEEQVGREDKPDKNIDDVMEPEVEEEPKEDKEEDDDKVTITITEGYDNVVIGLYGGDDAFPTSEDFYAFIDRCKKSNVSVSNESYDEFGNWDIELTGNGTSIYKLCRDLPGYYSRNLSPNEWIEEFRIDESLITEDVDDIQAARTNLCQLLDDWYEMNIANEKSSDAKKAGWDSDLQQLFINFRNELNPDFIDFEEPIETEVDNIESDIDGLREMLEHNNNLEKQITDLQEKLSVSYAMEKKLNEDIDSYKEKISKLSKNSKNIKSLTEQLTSVKDSAKVNEDKLNESKKNIKKLTEKLNKVTSERDESNNELKTLKEDYEILNRDLNQTKDQFSKKFERQNKLLEKYQKITKNAVDKYINMQATHLGVKPVEIKNRLSEKFTFNDIDSICENLRDYKLNVSMLPFNTSSSLNEGINAKAINISENLLPRNEADDLTDYDKKLMEAYL